MGHRGQRGFRPFGTAIAEWTSVPGGERADGTMVGEPWELARARKILYLCERFHKLPSEILAEPAELLRLINITNLGGGLDGQ